MKRLLRSTLDFSATITQENLVQNFQKLVHANIEWTRPDDQRIYDYILRYFQQRLEIPSVQTLQDYFEKMGDGGDVEVIERIKDIEAAPFYIRTNYAHLLQTLLEEQNTIKSVALLKETHDIITKGVDIVEPGSREKIRKKGVREGLVHFTSKAHDLIIPEYNAKTAGDIRMDGQAVWNDYVEAKNNKDKAWGKFTGLNHIDVVCHGIKKGELWVHAGFAGELKCLTGSSTLYDHSTGRRRTVEEMYASGSLPIVTALDREGVTHRLVRAQASHLVQNGVRDVYELRLSSGRFITATSNHRFLTPSGWMDLANLPGCWVAVPKRTTFDGLRLFTDAEVKVVGYLIGDGGLTQGIRMTAENADIRHDFKECLTEMGLVEGHADYEVPSFLERFPDDHAPYVAVSHSAGHGNSAMVSPVRALLEALGLYGKDSYDKFIPNDFFSLPEDQVVLLLGALWSTDGSCHHGDHEREDRDSLCRRNDISYSSVSERLCLDVQSILLRLGIQSSVTRVDTTYKGEPYVFYTVRVVTRESKRVFTSLVHVVGKWADFDAVRQRIPGGDDTLIPSEFIPEGAKVPFIGGKSRYASQVKGRPMVTVDTAKLFAQFPSVRKVLDGDIAWERVVSVTPKGREMTYDLSVPEHHTFVANDIVTHNTTFALNWCYNLVTRYRSNVLYFSLEMTYEQVRRQVLALHTANGKWKAMGYKALDYRKIRDGELDEQEEVFFQKVIDDWTSNKDYCSFEIRSPDRDMTIDDIRLETELCHKQTEIGLLVIDHGQLLEPRKKRRSNDYVVELNSIVKDTKKLALHFNHGEKLAVLLLFQINRQGREEAAKNGGKYKATAIAYANEVEKSADYITTTFLDEEHRRNGTTYITNLKNRENNLFEPFYAAVDLSCRRMSNQDMTKLAGRGMSVEDMRQQTDATAYLGL